MLAIFGQMYYNTQVISRCDEMVDVADSKSAASDGVPVRVRSPAPQKRRFCLADKSVFFERSVPYGTISTPSVREVILRIVKCLRA